MINRLAPAKLSWSTLFLTLQFAGCAVGSVGYRVPNMIPEHLDSVPTPYSARVSAKADDTTWSRMMRVPDGVFVRAVQESLIKARTFSAIVTEGEADYALDVRMTDLHQPMAGIDVTVSVLAQWVLTDLATGTVVLDELIPTPFTVSGETAFSATQRVRIATEGAIQANIEEGLRRIDALKLRR